MVQQSVSIWLPLLFGSFLLVWAVIRAVMDRANPRKLIIWGAVHDLGTAIIALAAHTALAMTGLCLYVLFQAACRLLAWFSLTALERGAAGASQPPYSQTVEQLAGRGRQLAWPGALYGLGMLAAIGGSPFLAPEGRALIVSGLLENLPCGLFGAFMFMGATLTVLIWLYVHAVRVICLDKPGDAAPKPEPGQGLPALLWLFGLLVALSGIFRAPLAELLGHAFGAAIAPSPVHCSFWFYYIGAFATGLCFLWRMRAAAWIGALFCAGALASVCVAPAGPLANFFLIIISLIGLLVAIYSISYIHDERAGWYWFFLLLTFGSLAAIVSTPELPAMFGYWELMTFASYFLVAHEATKQAFAAAIKYYVMCAGGAVFMLPGLMALGAFSVAPGMALYFPFWLKAATLLCLAGFGVKAGLVPLHAWLPEAHPAAPSSVSAPLSGVITKMGVFGIVSVILIGAGSPERELEGFFGLDWFGTWLALMSAATLIYGEIMALAQTDIKKMLAYSTMGQIGEITLILSLGTWLATTGALWHVFNHAIMKDLLFLGAGCLIMRAGSRKLSDLAGLRRQMPWTCACMAVGLVSIMGLPPFGAFYSKFLMIQAAVNAQQIWAAVLLLLGALAGAIYYTRILKTLIFEPRPAELPQVEEAPFAMRLPLLVLAGVSLLLGLAPQLLIPLLMPIAMLCYEMPPNAIDILAAMHVNWPVYVIFPVYGAVLPAIFHGKPRMAGWMSVGVLLVSAALAAALGRNLDTLSYCFSLIVPIIGAINMTYAVGYMAHGHSQWRFYCAFTCMCGGLMGMAASKYLLGFFLFWEIMSSWTLYLAIAQEGTQEALKEAFKYFLFNLAGAGFLFVGLCLIGPDAPITPAIFTSEPVALPAWSAWAGMALLATGFVLKAAQLPFRIDWQMHPALAPTPVSGYISSVLLKSAIIGLIKLFMLVGGVLAFSDVLSLLRQETITVTVMWIGGITIIMAAWQALQTNGIKLVFIYSTVSQLGYMVLAVACGTALGYAGGMLHLVNHVFFKDLLFLVCGAVMIATGKSTLDELGGIGRKMPFTLLMFAIGGLSLIGVPPTSGFSSKWLIYQALMQAGQPLLALLSLLGSVLTLAYVAKFMHAAFFSQPADCENVHEAPAVMRLAMGILALGCILTGIFPGLALWPINQILAQYGSETLKVGISGLLAGPGAWNATAVFIMAAVAFITGWLFIRRFLRVREIDIHSCGMPAEETVSRMDPGSIYGDILSWLTGREKRQ